MLRNLSWGWWHTLVIPALESLGQEDLHKLEVSLGYIDKILSEGKIDCIKGGGGMGDGLASKVSVAT